MKLYKENPEVGNPYRAEYIQSVENYIELLREKSSKKREFFIPLSYFDQKIEFYRDEYKKMLGEPLASYKAGVIPNAKETFVASDDLCDIKRVQIEVLPNFFFYGMLFIPHKHDQFAPLVIAQHGGGGTPELCSDINGKNNYNHMVKRILEKNSVVFAPQLMLWNFEKAIETAPCYNVSYNRGNIDNQLKQMGGSIQALEIFCILRSIDYLEKKEYINSEKIGIIGLSYGGFYALYTMAADTRIKCGYSAGAFNDRFHHFMSDWSWTNSGNTFTDTEVCALCAPRKLYIEVGTQDKVFDFEFSKKAFEKVPAYYEKFGKKENVRHVIWNGGHTVNPEDDGLNFFLGEIL